MKKDFQRWHSKKTELNDLLRPPFFHEREIWFCYLGANVGFEQDGNREEFLRPIVVFRKFSNEVLWAIPLTKSRKKVSPKNERYYYPFSFMPSVTSVAILSQIRLIDARRLSRHIGTIAKNDFEKINEKLKALLP